MSVRRCAAAAAIALVTAAAGWLVLCLVVWVAAWPILTIARVIVEGKP